MEKAVEKAAVLIEALPYIQRFSGKPVVMKLGGSAMESDAVLDDVVEDVVFLAAVGIRTVVVHGGGPQISRAMEQAGLTPRFVHGHRVTDAETLRVAVEVLAGQINAHILEHIARRGGTGLSTFREGHSMLHARKKLLRAPGSAETTDIGFVGEVVGVEAAQMLAEAAAGRILVAPPIGQDDAGQLYNVNADTAAAAVAGALSAEKIVFMSNVHGIMADPADPESLLSTVTESDVMRMIEQGVITGGMLPKVSACIAALDRGVRKAHIIDGRLPHSLLLEIFTDRGVGTQILKDALPQNS